MRPIRTANFILILRMGTDGLMTPPGSTMEPEPPGASLSGQPAPSPGLLSALAMSPPHTAGMSPSADPPGITGRQAAITRQHGGHRERRGRHLRVMH
uniref:Uncharacterized protein n=1 Tax=Engystomops pustulosus TaxID=76066 RepID=A0AAV6YYT5_ENGPU|nr:hypothetical protein GDO81_019424 [Engystomops pustulosus]